MNAEPSRAEPSRAEPSRAEPSRAELRRTLARAVQAMIDLLDVIDGDADRELDEPDMEHDGIEPLHPELRG